jgi:hypothetical protein
MNIILWILLIAAAAIFCVSLGLIIHYHRQPAVKNIGKSKEKAVNSRLMNTIQEIENSEENSNMDFSAERKRIIDWCGLRWKEFPIAFRTIALRRGILFSFQGKTRKQQTILFAFKDLNHAQTFLDSTEDIWNENLVPENAFYFCIPYLLKDMDVFCREIENWFQKNEAELDFALTDGTNIRKLDLDRISCALVSVGTLASIAFSIEGTDSKEQFITDIQSSAFFKVSSTEQNMDILSSINKSSLNTVRNSFFQKNNIEKIAEKYPEIGKWMKPFCRIQENSLLVYASDYRTMLDAVSKLKEKASDSSLQLKTIKEAPCSICTECDTDAYRTVAHAIYQAFGSDVIIPIKTPYEVGCGDFQRIKSIRFTPSIEGIKSDIVSRKKYYESILMYKI